MSRRANFAPAPGPADAGREAPGTRPASNPFAELACALMGHVRAAVVVPGKPVESLTEWLPSSSIVPAIDEKSGFEQALGMAFQGVPVATVCKGGGVSCAWDSISNAVVHGTVDGEALIVVAADDPAASSSTVAVDSRALAATIGMPVIEPCALEHIERAVALAASLSLAGGEPVMLRFTTTLGLLPNGPADTRRVTMPDTSRAAPPATSKVRVFPTDGRRRAHGMTKSGRHVHHEQISTPIFEHLVDAAGLTIEHDGVGRTAVVAFGPVWSLTGIEVAERYGWPAMGSSVSLPLPASVVDFAARHDTVVVLEEGAPVAETALTLALCDRHAGTEVLGQRSGLPEQLSEKAGAPMAALWKDATGKSPSPPYDALFEAVRTVKDRHDLTVTTCVGSVIDVAAPPWNSSDLSLSLGSATGTAAGVAQAGGTALALTGDFGLLHSGLNSFEVIQRTSLAVLTVIVANGVSRRTGGQPTPWHPDEPNAFDLVRELRARGASRITTVACDELGPDDLVGVIESALGELPATLVLLSGDGVFNAPEGAGEAP